MGARLLQAVQAGEDTEDAEAGWLMVAETMASIVAIGRWLAGTTKKKNTERG